MSDFVFRAPFPRGYKTDVAFGWSRPQIELLLAWVLAVDTDIATRYPRLLAKVADYTNSGISQGQSGDRVSGGGRNDDGSRTKVLSMKHDPFAQAAQNIIIGIATIAHTQETLLRELGRLESATREDAKSILEAKPRLGTGECGNMACRHWCTGIGEDRLKGGRCPECAAYRNAAWNHDSNERPHAVCHKIGVGGCDLCMRAA